MAHNGFHLKPPTDPFGNIIVPHKIPLCHMLFQNKSSRHASKQDVGWVRLISLAFHHSTIMGGRVTTASVVKNSPSTSSGELTSLGLEPKRPATVSSQTTHRPLWQVPHQIPLCYNLFQNKSCCHANKMSKLRRSFDRF